jgi:hypothetical protein
MDPQSFPINLEALALWSLRLFVITCLFRATVGFIRYIKTVTTDYNEKNGALELLIFFVLVIVAIVTSSVPVQCQTATADSTTTPPIINQVRITFGESPLASGLAIEATAGDWTISLTEVSSEIIYLPLAADMAGVNLIAGPTTGIVGQLPYIGWLSIASSGRITALGWAGVSPGTYEGGVAPVSNFLFAFGQVKASLPYNLTVSVSVLTIEGADAQLLPALEWTPELRRGVRLVSSITLDENDRFRPMFQVGATYNP